MPAPSGPQFNAYPGTEMVPISTLKTMGGNKLRYDVSELSEDLKTRGFQEPGVITYNQHSRQAVLDEGNHRLAAAEQAGFTHMPAYVSRSESFEPSKRGVVVRGVEPNQYGYVPGRLSPSQIMDID